MTEPIPRFLAQIHLQRNRITRGDWQSFAPHRRRVTQLLCEARGSSLDKRSLCVLGAGNGNDLDLDRLSGPFAPITLVDLDRRALDHLLARQVPGYREQLSVVAEVDLSGILEDLNEPVTLASLPALIEKAKRPPIPQSLGQYDVVASTCLLTQLIDTVSWAPGLRELPPADPAADPFGAQPHPRDALALAVRDGHLRLLSELVAPRGTIVLITDFVSSDTLPELFEVEEDALGELISRAINRGNFFTGANPVVLAHLLATRRGDRTFDVQLHRPWRWAMGNRVFATAAITAKRLA